MVKRKLATLTASLALLIPASALALGLGNISMNSTLDQILKAEISIQSATAEDLKGLTVNLASAAMFAQYGIERPALLDELQFEVIQGGDGKNYIKLSSLKPIREPFLNFLVEAQWPNGHALRQFTVLVDPPTMMEKVPLQVAPVRVSKPTPVAQPERIAVEPMASRSAASSAIQPSLVVDSATGAIEYGPSKANDTLWGIAQAMRGDHDASIHQMMLAILRDNPDAFYRGNVNNLKMGYVLRINDPASITSVGSAAAEREISRQYQDWKSGQTSSTAALPVADKPAVQADAEESAKSTSAPASSMEAGKSAQLKLASAGSVDNSEQGTANVEDTEGLSEALALANEGLLANKQETDALQERLVKLEEQIQTLQRLVQLKDSQIASIQDSVEKPTQPATATPSQPAAESLFDSPTVLGLIALFVVLLGLLGYLLLQRRKQAEYQESILSQSAGAPVSELSASSFVSTGDTSSLSGQNKSESSLLTDFSSTTMEGLQTDIGEIDPISEADVYLAYGRYSQAEEIIQDALQNDSSREEYHVKLLEIHHAAGEKEKFLEAGQKFHSTLNGSQSSDSWDKVCVMGREMLPGNALFEGFSASDSDVDSSVQVLEEVEGLESEHMDALATPDDNADFDLDSATGKSSKEELDSFDFNTMDEPDAALTPQSLDDSFADFENEKLGSTEANEAATSGGSNALEFELGSMDELSTEASDEDTSKQKLDDEISENALDFGANLSAEQDGSVEDASVGDTDSLSQSGDHELDLTNSLDEIEGEREQSISSTGDDVPLNDDLHGFNFDTLEESAAGDNSVENDLEGVANQLDQSSTSDKEAKDDLDLSAINDLDDDGSDFDDDNPFANLDEVGTKLDLARAYVDMGDKEGAQSIIDEVMQEGTDEQKEEAQALLNQI